MDYVLSPEEVEQPDAPEPVVEVEVEVQTCALAAGCTTSVEETSYTCCDCGSDHCCDHIVSCHECSGWVCVDDANTFHGGGSYYCLTCLSQMTACVVCGAHINSEADSTNYCESHDGYCCESCYGGNDLCEPCYASSGGDEDEPNEGMGSSHVTPWELGETPNLIVYGELHPYRSGPVVNLWGIDQELSLNAGAADYYLLEVVQHNVDCGEIAEPMLVVMSEEARTYRKNLVATYDESFRGYVDMAIGGELRYHMAVGNGRILPGDRTGAWREWWALRQRYGVGLLLDAATLFREISGGGVGGERWAVGAELLHARLTDTITPEQWVDRVFTLQHNGGSFTNKIAWGPNRNETGSDITAIIGPAHHKDPTDFKTLTAYATPDARELFREWWPIANKNRIRWNRPMWTHPIVIDHARLYAMECWFEQFVNAGWTTPSIRKAKLRQWQADPVTAGSRFAAFHLVKALADHGVYVDWTKVDSHLARAVVVRTLHFHAMKATPYNLYGIMPRYVAWLCELIAAAPADFHVDAFKVLVDAGVQIPLEYRHLADLPAELDPF